MHNITYVKHSTWFLILVFINNMCEYFRLYRHQWLDPHGVFNNCHIFCCNMFVFACPIIAKCQCWLFALSGQISVFALFALKYPYLPYLPSNIRICPHISVFSPVFNFRYLHSGLKDYMSTYKERWCIKICIKSYFNQINTFQYIGIKFK